MKNRFLLTTSLVIASLLAFTTASAKDLRMAYDADPVTLAKSLEGRSEMNVRD